MIYRAMRASYSANRRNKATTGGGIVSPAKMQILYMINKGVEKRREQHQEPTEDIHVDVMEQEQVLEMLRDGEIIQALHAAPLWKYFAQLKN